MHVCLFFIFLLNKTLFFSGSERSSLLDWSQTGSSIISIRFWRPTSASTSAPPLLTREREIKECFCHCVSMCSVFIYNTVCVWIFFRKLTKVLKNYVDNAEKLAEQLLKALKALDYIFKFIVRSRVLFNQYVLPSHSYLMFCFLHPTSEF